MRSEQQQVMYLSLTLSRPGIRRKIGNDKVQVDADKSMISVTKEILDSSTYRKIVSLDGEIRHWVRARSLPAPALKTGVYAVPVGLVTQVEEKLREFEKEREELVKRFVSLYPERVEEARTRLRSNFNSADYPSARSLSYSFRLRTRYVSFDVPASLEEVSGDMFKREQAKAARAWEETLDEWKTLLRTGMADLVNHMVERLEVNGDGKPRIFRDSLVGNLRDFLGTFNARNVADDKELGELAEKARALLGRKVTPERLREDTRCREAVAAGFTEIKNKLDTMIVDKPKRRITFGDDD